jgi:hypothetical protein
MFKTLKKAMAPLLTTLTVGLSSLGPGLPRTIAHEVEHLPTGTGKDCQVFTIPEIPKEGLRLDIWTPEEKLQNYRIEFGI